MIIILQNVPVGVVVVVEEELHCAVERPVHSEPGLLQGDVHQAVRLTVYFVGQVRVIPGSGGPDNRAE